LPLWVSAFQELALTRTCCAKLNEAGIHEKRGGPCGKHVTAIPRYNEIAVCTFHYTIRDLASLPKGWLR
jgi:hypothetical protein